jgi:hypothetical protein
MLAFNLGALPPTVPACAGPLPLFTEQAPFELIGPIYPLLDQYAAEKLREDYTDDGTVTMELRVEESMAQRLQSAVQNATSGRVVPSVCG